jgi:hypothetical protein
MRKPIVARMRPLVTTMRFIPISTIVESSDWRCCASLRRAAGTSFSSTTSSSRLMSSARPRSVLKSILALSSAPSRTRTRAALSSVST